MTEPTDLPSGSRFVRKEERRAFPRWPVKVPATGYSNLNRFECGLIELNETGACFFTPASADIGPKLTLAFGLGDGDTPVTVECHVRRTIQGCTGVEFLNPTVATRLRILRFVSRI